MTPADDELLGQDLVDVRNEERRAANASDVIGAQRLFEPPPSLHLTLADRFLVPPFSVLDARAGYWQARKRDWLELGLVGEVLGRPEELTWDGDVRDPNNYHRKRGGDSRSNVTKRLERLGEDGRDENLLGMSDAVNRQQTEGSAYPRGKGAEQAAEYERTTRTSQTSQAPPGRDGELAHRTSGIEVRHYWSDRQHALKTLMEMHSCTEEEAQERWEQQERERSDRKGGRLGETGRGEQLLSSGTPRAGYGGDYDLSKGENAWGGAGTSIFDPVLCELCYRWWAPQSGHILDPFAGGSVRGIVAAMLGRRYTGIDLRPEQVQANEEQRAHIGAQHEWEHQPSWLLGDARDVGVLCAGEEYDFLFTCPPYYDLEVYGDDPRDLSRASSYAEFRNAFAECIYSAAQLLRDDRFAAIVVGEVRDKQGVYHGLVPDTIQAFTMAGLRLYNEAILVTSVGSLPIRVSRAFPRGRKLGKSHQNVLVFLKGDAQRANDACGPLGAVAVAEGVEAWDTEEPSTQQPEERKPF